MSPADEAAPATGPRLVHNPAASRYEAWLGETLAGFADYRQTDGAVLFTHTEVDPAYGGRGVGSALARFGLDDVRLQGRTVVPLCSFIARYVEQNPGYSDLLG